MRIAFLGTPEIGATILLDLINSGLNITAVITQPDRPAGRSGTPVSSPVKNVAISAHIPVYQPSDKAELTAMVTEINPDICIVAAYGMIIPNDALEIPKYGMINFHPSLLPLLRGPSPIPMAIMYGHKKTGVSIIQVAEKMDAGDILIQNEFELKGDETTPSLSVDLAHLGAKLLLVALSKIQDKTIAPQKQDDKDATFSHIIKKTDGEVLFQKYHAKNIEQASRAFTPWPGVYTTWNGKKIELFDVTVEKKPDDPNYQPGKVEYIGNKIIIGTAKGSLSIGSLKIEGKNQISAKQFASGYQEFIGTTLK